MFRFENLEIWKIAVEYGEKIHKISRKFPKSEQFVLTTDLNRAAISVSSNIAEGSGSESNNEFIRYLRISLKSTFETVSQLYIAQLRKYITKQEYKNLYSDADLLVRKIKTLVKRLK